jgi:hypothetical protein
MQGGGIARDKVEVARGRDGVDGTVRGHVGRLQAALIAERDHSDPARRHIEADLVVQEVREEARVPPDGVDVQCVEDDGVARGHGAEEGDCLREGIADAVEGPDDADERALARADVAHALHQLRARAARKLDAGQTARDRRGVGADDRQHERGHLRRRLQQHRRAVLGLAPRDAREQVAGAAAERPGDRFFGER